MDELPGAPQEPDDGSAPLIARASIRRNVSMTASSQVVGWVLGTIAALIVPRYVGPEVGGQVQLAWSLWAIGGVITSFGSDTYLQLAIARDQRSGLALMGPVAFARTISFSFAACGVALYVVLADVDETVAGMAVVVGLSILLGQWSGVISAAFFGLERMSSVAVQSMVFRVLGLAVTLTVVWLDLGIFGVLWSGFGMAVLSAAALVWTFRKSAPLSFVTSRAAMRKVVAGSVPFMVVGLALMTYRQIDVLVIVQVAGERDLGWYTAADTLFGSLMFPTTIILGSIFPTLGRLYKEDQDGLRDLVRRTFSLLIVSSVPIGIGAALVGPTVAPLIFGDRFSGTGPLLAIFGPVTVLTFGTTLFATVAMASDRHRFVATLLFASAALTVPLDIVLVPWASDRFENGAIGGAMAFIVTEAIQFAVLLKLVAPYTVTRDWAWRTSRVFAAAGVMALAVWPVRESLFPLPVSIGVVAYGLAIWVFRCLDDFQRATLVDVVGRLRPNR